MPSTRVFAFESEKWDADLAFLARRLRAVLADMGEGDIGAQLPWCGEEAAPRLPLSPRAVQAMSLSFQLLNMVEENTANQSRRRRASLEPGKADQGAWPRALAALLGGGFDEAAIREHLSRTEIVPTMTAHPTEAKRATVLEHHRRLYVDLVRLENQMWTARERSAIEASIEATLEKLLRTGEVFFEKPDITSEARNVLYYLEHVFPVVLPRLYRRFVEGWQETFGDESDPPEPPRLRFGSWVGGDRDGHPFVTAELTRSVLAELRDASLGLLDASLKTLASHLSLSSRHQEVPPELTTFLRQHEGVLDGLSRGGLPTNPEEPWRQALNIARARLPFEGRRGAYARPEELVADLEVLQRSLRAVRASRIAAEDVAPVKELVRTFGFHFASLDLRQNSAYLEKAVEQILSASGATDSDFSAWTLETRTRFLSDELASRRPLVRRSTSTGEEGDEIRRVLALVNEHSRAGSDRSVEAFIVSMTRHVADLLSAHLVAKESEFVVETEGGAATPIPVVPLFETRDDLLRSPAIMEEYLAHPHVKRSLALVQRLRGYERPIQEVMLGYSDSCKDAGIIASAWSLYSAQEKILEVGERLGIGIRFFHGRGGTVSRGAGPMHRFLSALPPGSLRGGVRITEQGETISQKYANTLTATFNLEVLVAGASAEGLLAGSREGMPGAMRAHMDDLASASAARYAALLASEGFLEFYREATPLDVIERSKIGSRPSRRRGASTLDGLRAIPWVFSWNQSRFFLPGWYGSGTALAGLRDSSGDVWQRFKEGVRTTPALYYLFANIETTLHSASREMFSRYAGLVKDARVRERFLEDISSEYALAQELLDDLFDGAFAARRPRLAKTLALRDQPLDALHKTQIERLAEWRATGNAEDTPLFDELLLITNAIASGLRTTG